MFIITIIGEMIRALIEIVVVGGFIGMAVIWLGYLTGTL